MPTPSAKGLEGCMRCRGMLLEACSMAQAGSSMYAVLVDPLHKNAVEAAAWPFSPLVMMALVAAGTLNCGDVGAGDRDHTGSFSHEASVGRPRSGAFLLHPAPKPTRAHLLGSEAEDCCEWSCLGHAEHPVGELGIRCQDDLECDLAPATYRVIVTVGMCANRRIQPVTAVWRSPSQHT